MELKPFASVLVCAILLLGGFVYSYLFPVSTAFADLPFTLASIVLFIAGVVFFGYLAAIPALLFGLQLGAERNAAIFLYIIPSLLSIYAGTKLGFAMQEDLFERRNVLQKAKEALALLIIVIVIALAVEAALPYILQFWPKDYLGLNVIQGTNALSTIDRLSSFARR